MIVRKIDYDKDKQMIDEYNKNAKYKVDNPKDVERDMDAMNLMFYGHKGVKPVSYGVFDDDKLIGALNAESAGPAGATPESGIYANPYDYMFNINVLPEHQSKGVGHMLIDEFKKDHKGRLLIGVISISDDVNRLKDFYKSCGADVNELNANNIYIKCTLVQKSNKDKVLDKLADIRHTNLKNENITNCEYECT